MKLKLAEALLRRKELDGKVKLLGAFKQSQFFETKVVRKNVTDNIDDITATVPKLTASQVTAEFDFYSRQLRLVDAAIQQANWTTEIDTQGDVMADYGEGMHQALIGRSCATSSPRVKSPLALDRATIRNSSFG